MMLLNFAYAVITCFAIIQSVEAIEKIDVTFKNVGSDMLNLAMSPVMIADNPDPYKKPRLEQYYTSATAPYYTELQMLKLAVGSTVIVKVDKDHLAHLRPNPSPKLADNRRKAELKLTRSGTVICHGEGPGVDVPTPMFCAYAAASSHNPNAQPFNGP